MLVRIQVRLLCPSQSDANTVRDAIVQKLATKPLRVIHSDISVVLKDRWMVVGDVSFQLRVDADDIYGDVQAKWTSGGLRNRILAGSTVTLHVCSHADGEPPPWGDCRELEFTLAEKR